MLNRVFVGKPALLLVLMSLLLSVAQADSVVVFNELMYHPDEAAGQSEWIELHNQMSVDVDLSGWSIRGGVDYDFPVGTALVGGGYLVVAAAPEALIAETTYNTILGPFEGRLANGGEELRLVDHNQRTMDALDYRDGPPWPVAPDGSGMSLAKIEPNAATEDPANWSSSAERGGTPGQPNFSRLGSGWSVLIGARAPVWAYVPEGDYLGVSWTLPGFSHWYWTEGRLAAGYETKLNLQPNYADAIGLDLEEEMYGVNASCYLRMPFLVSDPHSFSSLTLRMRYDAGFIAYLNGTEVARVNAPKIAAWNSGATKEHFGKNALTPEEFDLSAFLDRLEPGMNLLAVHALSDGTKPDDFLMMPELQGFTPALLDSLAINEIAAADAQSFWVEIRNNGGKPVDLTSHTLACEGSVSNARTIGPVSLEPGDFLVLNQAELGFSPESGDRLFLYGPRRATLCDAAHVEGYLQGRAPDGTGRWQRPEAATPGEANRFAFHDEIVINEIMYHHRPRYEATEIPPVFEAKELLPMDAFWRYNQSGEDLGYAWKETDYADSTWQRGRAVLGREVVPGALPEPIRTTLDLGEKTTFYFRTTFEFDGTDREFELRLRTLIDDGVVFYLNGQEIHRQNMPDGPIDHLTTSTVNVIIATFGEPFAVPTESLRVGTNVLAAEVHQFQAGGKDLAFAAAVALAELIQPTVPAVEYEANNEQWIELHNASDHSVDLGGWAFSQGIEYAFPSGTSLEAGGYLVVSNNAEALKAKYPDSEILGDFSRQLALNGERIELVDDRGNIADEVRYYDTGRWPEHSDGGGTSLELRDPRADNAQGEAWASSDESGRSSWRRYYYSGVAKLPVYQPDINFHEFHMGLLDKGEVLLDNISVIEAPGISGAELMQNSTFETEYTPKVGMPAYKWRIQGTHERSVVIDDPDDPENRVLHMIADGRTNYVHNKAETTLANQAEVVDGTEYLISFDAKWLAGSPQLHCELYYNDVVRTVILDQPDRAGTPGRQNSRYEPNIAPTFSDFGHAPVLPLYGENVGVAARAQDPDGVASIDLLYAVYGTGGTTLTWNRIPMALGEDGLASATIPGQPNDNLVQFYVEATDALGAVGTFPPSGPDSRAVYRPQKEYLTPVVRHDVRFFMTAADVAFLHLNTNYMSNNRLGATLIYDGREAFYDVGVRKKGSMFSRDNPAGARYNFRFDPTHLFRGVHETIVSSLADANEIRVKHIVERAGGHVPAMYDDLVRLDSPGGYGAGMVGLSMARFGDVFLESQYENGGDGNVYKLEGIRIMQNNTGAENLKTHQPVGWRVEYDIVDLGDDKEQYRWSIQLNRNRDRDDFSRIIDMCKAFSLKGEELDRAIPEVIDVEEWMRKFAIMSLCGIGDIYGQYQSTNPSNPHNLNMYVRPSDNKVLAMPWDWDFVFNIPATSSLLFDKSIGKIVGRPVFMRRYYWHVNDLLDSVYSVEYLERWLLHYGRMANADSTGNVSYVDARSKSARSQLPKRIPFEITTNDGKDFSVGADSTVIEGRAWFDVKEIRLNGSDQPLDVTWLDVNTWRARLPLDSATNSFEFAAYNNAGAPMEITSNTISVTRSRVGGNMWILY